MGRCHGKRIFVELVGKTCVLCVCYRPHSNRSYRALPQGATEHVPMYLETVLQLIQRTIRVCWDDIESLVRVVLNNGIDVNRVWIWQL